MDSVRQSKRTNEVIKRTSHQTTRLLQRMMYYNELHIIKHEKNEILLWVRKQSTTNECFALNEELNTSISQFFNLECQFRIITGR